MGITDNFLLKLGVVALLTGIWLKPPVVEKVEAEPVKPVIQSIQYEFEQKDKHCLAVMIYGEARSETFYGKSGVAYVALNRYQSGHYNSVCQVVVNANQFHAFANSNLRVAALNQQTPKNVNTDSWEESKKVATLAYDEVIPDPTKGATYFLNPRKIKQMPRWVHKLKRTVVIDNHHFYG